MHYHGGPITPARVLATLAGKCFCVSHAAPQQIEMVHRIGQSVLLDNGAFTKFTRGTPTNWAEYYDWSDVWLDYPTTWAIIPDEIAAGSQEQDALIREWPHGHRGAPVWHTSEPLARLFKLADDWPRVAIGSTDEHWQILSDAWRARMEHAFNGLTKRHRRTPWIHMLRGMQLSTYEFPFASVDSTDIARNHNRAENVALKMADRWDAANCPPRFRSPPRQLVLFA